MKFEETLLDVASVVRQNNLSFEVRFNDSLAASRFEVAFHELMEKTKAEEKARSVAVAETAEKIVPRATRHPVDLGPIPGTGARARPEIPQP